MSSETGPTNSLFTVQPERGPATQDVNCRLSSYALRLRSCFNGQCRRFDLLLS
eukprot:m.463432 g.463432  ORF g.463432 m.463432 type:complete len:53 (+) comp23028_c0_seq1:269-427(+)